MLQHSVDLDLDDPSNLPAPTESPERNGSMTNIYQDDPRESVQLLNFKAVSLSQIVTKGASKA